MDKVRHPSKSSKEKDSNFGIERVMKIGWKRKESADSESHSLAESIENDLDNAFIRRKPTRRELREFEEMDADVNFTSRARLSGRIPWRDFSELEIQAILKIHFENLGYNVRWPHRDDPSHESGVDLDCTSKRGKKHVLVAVKKKPLKTAIAQVLELSRKDAEERVYVYVDGAAESFQESIKDFRRKVAFWDENRLEEHLRSSEMTLSLRLDNSLANHAQFAVMKSIMNVIGSEELLKLKLVIQNKNRMLDDLWGIKDRAVTLNKCASMIQLMLEDNDRFGRKLSYETLEALTLWCFDYLYVYALVSLKNFFEHLTPTFKILLARVHERTRIRSNWLELYTYRPGLMPGRVLATLEDYEKQKAKYKPINESLKNLRKQAKKKIPLIELTEQEKFADLFRHFGIWAHGLESTVDDLFTKAVRGQVPP